MEILCTKKIFFIWCLLSPLPVLATGINSGVSDPACDNSVMGTYSGNVALEAEYEANGIPIQWYDNNEEMTVSSAAASCDYGGNVTVAQNPPSRTGYVFVGWNLCSLANADATEYPHWWYRGQNNCGKGYQGWSSGNVNCNSEEMSGLAVNEFRFEFSYGIVYGKSLCSGKTGNNYSFTFNGPSSNWSATQSELNSATGDATNCWCGVIGFKPMNTSRCSFLLPAIFRTNFDSEAACASSCTMYCAAQFGSSQSTSQNGRTVFFGQM